MNMLALQRRMETLTRDVDGLRARLDAALGHLEALRGDDRAPTDASAETWAMRMIEARRARRELLGTDLFADPAWDMLLSLFIAAERGAPLSVVELCAASSVRHTTALRWIETLEKEGLIRRRIDSRDTRRTLVSLTDRARETMRALLERMIAELSAPVAPAAAAAD